MAYSQFSLSRQSSYVAKEINYGPWRIQLLPSYFKVNISMRIVPHSIFYLSSNLHTGLSIQPKQPVSHFI